MYSNWCPPATPTSGLDASSYRSSGGGHGDGGGGDQDLDGDGGVTDPYEGTAGLFVTCPACHASVVIQKSQVQLVTPSHTHHQNNGPQKLLKANREKLIEGRRWD